MKTRLCRSIIALSLVLALTSGANALTVSEFISICESTSGDCADHPLLQAYVGGALDLVAALDEDTDYLAEIYCKSPRDLFDVPAIIRFVQGNADGYGGKNAMLLVIRYLEEYGEC